jgi:hypothetical protein
VNPSSPPAGNIWPLGWNLMAKNGCSLSVNTAGADGFRSLIDGAGS